MQKRQQIEIAGRVQGVGFRPFIYNLALRLGITGTVANTTRGVTITAQASPSTLDNFCRAILNEHPPLALPEILDRRDLPAIQDEKSFLIQNSRTDTGPRALVTPDAATCPDCLAELTDPADRRYRYPFINCTNCGPRYTIIFDVPYDRPNTTMRDFTMCPACQKEYDNPADRRFHAQPNACPVCGPSVYLTDPAGNTIITQDPIQKTIELIQSGHILAIKGLGGFHLAVRADSDPAVTELRSRKYRKAKAFALMVRDLDTARKIATVSPVAAQSMTDIKRPIVLCPKSPDAPISPDVAPASRFYGLMLPYTPLHSLVMQGDFPALVMTSGNNSDEPIECENDGALDKLKDLADYFLMHNRPIHTSCDDSVIKVFEDKPQIIRRARGFAPVPQNITCQCACDILAVGAELKSTITVVKQGQAFTSQHIGDLRNAATYEAFIRTIEKLTALVDAHPRAIACDLHPAMLSTRFAETYRDIPIIRVQHHHAHIAAVIGEYNLTSPVVGIVTDGVGFGPDQTVWGCEAMAVWPHKYQRFGHLEPVVLPGGDAAARQPWRMALSCLHKTFGSEKAATLARELLPQIPTEQIQNVCQIIDADLNCPATSSLGRFFDAVSALLGVCAENTYEAQAAIELEDTTDLNETTAYPLEIIANHVIAVTPVICALVKDLQNRTDPAIISARFHNFVVNALTHLAFELARTLDTDIVALSGGVFQNDLILSSLVDRLRKSNLKPYVSRQLPVNDGAISFGQAIVADAIMAKNQI